MCNSEMSEDYMPRIYTILLKMLTIEIHHTEDGAELLFVYCDAESVHDSAYLSHADRTILVFVKQTERDT